MLFITTDDGWQQTVSKLFEFKQPQDEKKFFQHYLVSELPRQLRATMETVTADRAKK